MKKKNLNSGTIFSGDDESLRSAPTRSVRPKNKTKLDKTTFLNLCACIFTVPWPLSWWCGWAVWRVLFREVPDASCPDANAEVAPVAYVLQWKTSAFLIHEPWWIFIAYSRILVSLLVGWTVKGLRNLLLLVVMKCHFWFRIIVFRIDMKWVNDDWNIMNEVWFLHL